MWHFSLFCQECPQENKRKEIKNQVLMHGFKSAILEKLKICQNGAFEPIHFLAKSILLKHYENGNKKKYS